MYQIITLDRMSRNIAGILLKSERKRWNKIEPEIEMEAEVEIETLLS